MKSLFRKISGAVLCAALGSSLILGASACGNGPSGAGEEIYVVSITQTEDGYVVLYSDGTSQTFGQGAQQGEGAVASALRSCVTASTTFITMIIIITSGSMRLCTPSHSRMESARLSAAAMMRIIVETSLS